MPVTRLRARGASLKFEIGLYLQLELKAGQEVSNLKLDSEDFQVEAAK